MRVTGDEEGSPVLLPLAISAALAADPAFDHAYASLAAFLDGAVQDDGVDYDTLRARRALLDAHLTAVAAAPVARFTPEERLALYVNAYNGYTLAVVLDAWPLRSIRDLDDGHVWTARRFVVGGASLTLDDMEHGHARKLADGRVHAVVNCASRGCPPLPPAPLTPVDLDAQLDAAAKRWARTNAVVVEAGAVRLSRIFEWYAADFTRWRTVDLPRADDAQDAAIGFLGAFGGLQVDPSSAVAWNPYDWSLNVR